MSKTHWKSLINPDYLGAYSLSDSGDMTVTIDYVVSEEITGSQGKKEYTYPPPKTQAGKQMCDDPSNTSTQESGSFRPSRTRLKSFIFQLG